MSVDVPRTLATELTDAFRIVIAGAVAMVVVLGVSLIWFTTAGDPSTDRAAQVVGRSQGLESTLLTEESLLRAYVITGNESVLESYRGAQEHVDRLLEGLSEVSAGHTTTLVHDFTLAERRWEQTWVARAIDPSRGLRLRTATGPEGAAGLSAFIGSGSGSFENAITAAQRVLSAGQQAQVRARHITVGVIAGTAALLLMIGIACGVATVQRRRRLDRHVVGPIRILLAKMRAVGQGDFGPSPVIDAPVELLELRDELADMSASLKLQQQALATRAEDAAASARRMSLVVEFAREVSDSLTLSHVLDAVSAAGCRLVESPRVRIWLAEDDGRQLALRHDSTASDVADVPRHDVGLGGLGSSAKDRRLTYTVGLAGAPEGVGSRALVAAVPLVKGTRLIGVLEIALPADALRLNADTVDVLVATASHAATAIDAAMLYALSESLSRADALTGLANRRRLDQDIELELERAGRYDRPLSFFMLDIDHFKLVNDTFGHTVGDTVLREVAQLLRDEMRASDTAYRYGGEEFAVLARDTDLPSARIVAERLRRRIAERSADDGDERLKVTISVGLVSVSPQTEAPADLIDAADRALYSAKRAGRNQVRATVDDVPRQRMDAVAGARP